MAEINLNFLELALLVIFLACNLVAFVIMWLDKLKSRQPNTERISEGLLFFLATAGGSLGVYLGMFAFRHKTRKWYFLIGIPLLLLENLASVYLIYSFLNITI